MISKDEPVRFSNSPLVEVSCGIQFQEMPLQTAHFGGFWERIKADFPTTLDQPTLPPVIETPLEAGVTPPVYFQLLGRAPMPRVFFIDEGRQHLIQLQTTRFHFNWQRADPKKGCPRFVETFAVFLKHWSNFLEFADSAQLPRPLVSQYELTYVNHVSLEDGADNGKTLGLSDVFSWLTPPANESARSPEVECALHYPLVECQGRLHAVVRTATRVQDGRRVAVFELTARGAPAASADDPTKWFMDARRASNAAFVSLTSEEAQRTWGPQS